MAGERGGAAVTPQPCEEQALRSHIESVAAGKTNLTDAQLVDLLCSAFPQSYPRRHRKLLIERVAKLTPLQCRREQAKKRRKINEARTVNRRNEVDESSDSDGSRCGNLVCSDGFGDGSRERNKSDTGGRKDVNAINRPNYRDLGGSDKFGGGGRETNNNGDGGKKDVNGINLNYRDLGGSDKLGRGSKEKNNNGDGGRKDLNGINRPNYRDLWVSDKLGGGSKEKYNDGDGGRKDLDGMNRPNYRDLGGSDKLGCGSKEKNNNGDGGRNDLNGINGPNSRGLGLSDELGGGSREMNKNGNGGRKDLNGINPPNSWDLEGSDGRIEMNNGRGMSEKNNRPMFRDLGGMHRVISELKMEVLQPLRNLKVLRHLGIKPTSRILLHGPPGCGKTTLSLALANEAGLPFYETSAAELVSGFSGAAQANIRELFSTAYMSAPSIVFIDEIDEMTSEKESLWKRVESCPVKQLMDCMDEPVNHDSNSRPVYVLVIGATNRPDALNLALRRRFDREIVIGVPSMYERSHILSILARNLKLEVGFDLSKISRGTEGFVAGDLVALVKKAGMNALDRFMYERMFEPYNELRVGVQPKDRYRQPFYDEELENLNVTVEDFVGAGEMVRPSSKMERFSTTPNTKWADVGGLQSLKSEFERHIVKHIKFPEVYKDLELKLSTSYFLYGPPDCGKTLLVEALANEAGANLMHIKAPQLVEFGDERSWVVQNIFGYASAHPPSIVFFDELDVPTPCGNEARPLDFKQLILEFNNTEAPMRGVYVIGAASRMEIVRHISYIQTQFDKVLYVPLPSPEERGAILRTLARNKPIDAKVDLMALGKDFGCHNFSGRDLSALMREASRAAIDRPTLFDGGCSIPFTIKDVDFRSAMVKISPPPPPFIQEMCEKMNVVGGGAVMEW